MELKLCIIGFIHAHEGLLIVPNGIERTDYCWAKVEA